MSIVFCSFVSQCRGRVGGGEEKGLCFSATESRDDMWSLTRGGFGEWGAQRWEVP